MFSVGYGRTGKRWSLQLLFGLIWYGLFITLVCRISDEINLSILKIDDNIAERNTLFSLDESPLDYVLSKELIERVGKAVKELPPQYKRVFELSRYKNLTYAEISEEMGVSVNAVKLYQKKALAQLRQVLKEYLPASPD